MVLEPFFYCGQSIPDFENLKGFERFCFGLHTCFTGVKRECRVWKKFVSHHFESFSKFSLLTHLALCPQNMFHKKHFDNCWSFDFQWDDMYLHTETMHQAQTSIQMNQKLIQNLPQSSEFSNKHTRSQINSFFHSKYFPIMVWGYDLRLGTHVSIKMQEYCTNKCPSSSSKDIDILNPKSHDFKPMLFLIEQTHQSSIL